MKDYFIDIEMNHEVEQWLLDQGASVILTSRLPVVDIDGKRKTVEREYDVYFNGERIFFWPGSNQARIYFSKENISAALILLIKWPNRIRVKKLPN